MLEKQTVSPANDCSRPLVDQAVRGATILGLLAAVACSEKTTVWVIPGSTSTHLEFGISTSKGGTQPAEFVGVRIYPCRGPDVGTGAHWAIYRVGDTSPYPTRVVYGQTPEGFVTVQGPTALKADCYRVEIGGTGRTEFLVSNEGVVTEVPFGSTRVDVKRDS